MNLSCIDFHGTCKRTTACCANLTMNVVTLQPELVRTEIYIIKQGANLWNRNGLTSIIILRHSHYHIIMIMLVTQQAL